MSSLTFYANLAYEDLVLEELQRHPISRDNGGVKVAIAERHSRNEFDPTNITLTVRTDRVFTVERVRMLFGPESTFAAFGFREQAQDNGGGGA